MRKQRILICVMCILLCVFLTGCKKDEVIVDDNHIAAYTISYLTNEDTAKMAERLCEKIQDLCDTKMSVEADKLHMDEYVIYIGGEKLAGQTGTDISAINEKGYLMTYSENKIYLYALSDEGFNRGFNSLLKYVNQDGSMNEMAGRIVNSGIGYPSAVMVGDANVSEYVIVLPKKTSDVKEAAAKKLQYYISEVSGAYLPIIKEKEYKDGKKGILLEDCTSEELMNTDLPYVLEVTEGIVKIRCSSEENYEGSVNAFANTYLGFAYAGSDDEHISTFSTVLRIPYDTTFMADGITTWMEEREAIVCLWKTNIPRGAYYDGNAALSSEIMSYSDDQIYEYIKMLKYCGFTGIQVTDICANWSAFGGYEFVHDRLRTMADAAHSLDMNFTLWVWGAEFTGYGWVDENVTYSADGYTYAYENPAVVDCFEKYYSIYAQLADCTDRVIAHYSDPGQLTNSEDIGYFAAMLREKFRAVNPDVSFGVNCWRNDIDRGLLKKHLGTDFIAHEGGEFDDPEGRSSFRGSCNYLEIPFGTWSWNGCEMEIDQLAQMNVNAKMLQKRYQEAVAVDAIRGESVYWAEMDSYHLLNVFSLYCAGHLLQDPFADADEVLRSVAYDMVGEEYGESMYEILDLIQDARTGDSYDTFFHSKENYILTSENYNAKDILERCNRLLPVLQEMIEADLQTNVVPLPCTVTELLKLVEPHIAQIQQFAQFRKDMKELESSYSAGAGSESLQIKLNEIYKPIPEYNCIIGMWGQVEARAQYHLVEAFCQKTGLEVPTDPVFKYYRKQRLYQEMCSFQKGKEDIYYRQKGLYQWGAAYGMEDTVELENELIAEGLLSETEDGYIYVTNWENYRYHFN